MPEQQTYRTHRRYMPAHHFVVQPILFINLFIQLWYFARDLSFDTGWAVMFALGLVVFSFTSRIMPLTAQNRVIRLEEQLRLMRLLPAEEHSIIGQLSAGQLVGLRFAADDEVAELARRCVRGELKSSAEIKKNIRQWRPDYLRV